MKASNALSLHSSELQWLRECATWPSAAFYDMLWSVAVWSKERFVGPTTILSKWSRWKKKKAVQTSSAQRNESADSNRLNPPTGGHCHASPRTSAPTALKAQFTMLYVFSLRSILVGLTGEFHFLTTMWEKCQLLSTMLWLISFNRKPSLPLKIAPILGVWMQSHK